MRKPTENKKCGWARFYVLAALFSFTNLLPVIFLYIFSGNFWHELLKWAQFASLLFPLFILAGRVNRYAAGILCALVYFFYYSLIGYFIVTRARLDFSFLKRNFGDIDNILPHIFLPLSAIFLLALAASLFMSLASAGFIKKHGRRALVSAGLAAVLFVSLCFAGTGNELVAFARSIYRTDEVIDFYQREIYEPLLRQSAGRKEEISGRLAKTDLARLPDHLDNIIILHLESINGFLVNEKITPNLIAYAREGIFFPKFYANGVQTILAYESILCSLPPSFDMNLVQGGHDRSVLCLPEALKSMNYRNYFFKAGIKTDRFIANLGFDEMRNNDIMRPDDEKYAWGYREDIFYERAFAYLGKNMQPGRNFIYIDVGATNHWPFFTPPGFENEVPFISPANFRERLSNTTHLLDRHLGVFRQKITELFPDGNYTLLILGDHSWPAEFHPGNTFNETLAYEENFTTAMVMVLGGEEKYKGIVIDTKYSQMDIMPGFLGLFGVAWGDDPYRRSFMPEIEGGAPASHRIILIQPYADKYLNLVNRDKIKFQYNALSGLLRRYDLSEDPRELSGEVIAQKADCLPAVKKIFPHGNF